MKRDENWDKKYKIGDYEIKYIGDEKTDFKKGVKFAPMAFIIIRNFECLWKTPIDPRLKIGDICKAFHNFHECGYCWNLISWLDGVLIVNTVLKQMNFSFVNKKDKRLKIGL